MLMTGIRNDKLHSEGIFDLTMRCRQLHSSASRGMKS